MDNIQDQNTTDTSAAPVASTNAQIQDQPVAAVSSEEKIAQYEREIEALQSSIAALKDERAVLVETIESDASGMVQHEKALAPVIAREQKVLNVLGEVSRQEHSAKSPQDQRTYEQQRWASIEEWHAVEQEKWQIQEALEAAKKRADEHRAQHVALEAREAQLRTQIEQLKVAEEKEKLNIALHNIVMSRIDTESKLLNFEAMRAKVAAALDATRESEAGIEKKEEAVESTLLTAHALADERRISEERYALEKERHEVESVRWQTEDQMTQLGGSITEYEKILSELKQKESDIMAKLSVLSKPPQG